MPGDRVPTRTRERPLAPTWLRLLCITGLGLALTLWVWGRIIERYPAAGGGDGLFFFRLIEAGKISVSRWRELPLWNPYECGGVPLWDNPQSIVAAPLILLLQPFDTTVTMGAWLVAHVTAGFVGTWLLCRDELRTTRMAALAASCLFAFSVSHTTHLAGGHTAFASFQFAPLALFFWRRAEADPRMAIGLGLLVANVIYGGGVYPLAFIGLMLGVETLTRVTSLARAPRIARAGAIALFFAVTVGAARLLPVVDQLLHHERSLAPETDFIEWQLLKKMFLARTHALRFGHEYVWPEYASYTGPVVLALAAVGLVLGLRRHPWMLAVAGVLLLVMLGHFAAWAPWTLLKGHVPPFVSMRVPSRFRLLLVLFIACWVALAMDRLPRALEALAGGSALARAARVVVTSVALLAAGDVASQSMRIIDAQWSGPAPASPPVAARLHLGGPGLAEFIDQPRQNRGRLECWEEWAPYAGAPLWTGDVPQARAATPGAVVKAVHRTQGSFLVDVEAPEPTTILFNSSFARGFRTDTGVLREQGRQLVADIPAGHHRMRVWYWPVGLTAGLVVTAFGLALAALGLWRLRPLR